MNGTKGESSVKGIKEVLETGNKDYFTSHIASQKSDNTSKQPEDDFLIIDAVDKKTQKAKKYISQDLKNGFVLLNENPKKSAQTR